VLGDKGLPMLMPSENGDNGRDACGRFMAGNPGGPGNPWARKTATLRKTLLEAVGEDDIRAVVKVLLEAARQGEPWAVRELLDRAVGKVAVTADGEVVGRPAVAVQVNVRGVSPERAAVLDSIDSKLRDLLTSVPPHVQAILVPANEDVVGEPLIIETETEPALAALPCGAA
jgi:hypothetical protein